MARSKRSEFVAGLFILTCLAILVAIFILIGNWESLYREMAVYHVAFDQAPAVKSGSAVLLRGQVKGRVTDVEMRRRVLDEKTGAEEFYYVLALEMPAEIRLRRDAEIHIETKFIGEDAAVNIAAVGAAEPATDTLRDPIVGRGGSAMDSAVEALGIGEEQKEQIAKILANIESVTASLKETAPKIGTVTDNMAAVTSQLREKLPEIIAKVDDAVTRLKEASGKINGILAENRENIKSSIANVTETTENAKKDLKKLLDALNATTQDVRTLVASNSVNVSDTLVNVRQTSEQLKAASLEIRRAPWRLLHKPDQKESDTMNVFDASRSYANAVADLRSVAVTYETLLSLKAKGVAVDEQLLGAMLDRLKAAFQRYEEAEDALWKQWVDKAE